MTVYSLAGTAGAVDSAPVIVEAWHADATVVVDFAATSMLRALAVAIRKGVHGDAFGTIGAQPLSQLGASLTRDLVRDPAVLSALTHTMTINDAITLRDALDTAIAELTEAPSDFHQDAS